MKKNRDLYLTLATVAVGLYFALLYRSPDPKPTPDGPSEEPGKAFPRRGPTTDAGSKHRLKPIRSASGHVVRLLGKMPIEAREGEGRQDALTRFVEEISPALGIERTDLLVFQGSDERALTTFGQFVNGVKVEGGALRIHQNVRGEVVMVDNLFVPGTAAVDTRWQVPASVATAAAIGHATRASSANVSRSYLPKLLIHTFSPGGLRLAWKIIVLQPALGARGVGEYYVDARTGALERREAAVE